MTAILNHERVEEGTFTNCAYYNGAIRRGIGHEFTTMTNVTTGLGGTWRTINNCIAAEEGSDTSGRARVNIGAATSAFGRVWSRLFMVQTSWGGPIARSDPNDAGDYYGLLLRDDSSQLSIFRFDDDVAVQLATTAETFLSGVPISCFLSLDSGSTQSISGRDETNNVNLGRTADTTYTSGRIGVLNPAQSTNPGHVFENVFFDHEPASWTYVSPTIDQGAAFTASLDTVAWAESLSTGNVTLDVDIRASGNSGTYDQTALTNPDGSTFTGISGRYANYRINGTGNAAVTRLPIAATGPSSTLLFHAFNAPFG